MKKMSQTPDQEEGQEPEAPEANKEGQIVPSEEPKEQIPDAI